MLRGVLFDFNGTVAHLSSWGSSHEEVFVRRGLGDLAPRWSDGWLVGPADGEAHEAHSHSRSAYHAWELDRLRARARRCGVPEPEVEGLVREIDRETKDVVMRAYDDAADAVRALTRRGLVTAICSNWFWDIDLAVAQAGLAGMFRTVVTSAQAGMRKPDPRIYHRTLRRCGLAADEAIFVGDMWTPDVEGPRAVGMRAVHLWRPERGSDRGCPPVSDGVWRLPGLPEVVDLVDRLGVDQVSGSTGPARCG